MFLTEIGSRLIITSLLLGLGLSMDACAASMANGLNEPKMKPLKVVIIALMFGLFQGLMPLLGYFLGHAILNYIDKFIPWIALILLSFIGGKMLIDGIKNKKGEEEIKVLTFKVLFIQAIATSIDALSVGFTIADYTIPNALICVSLVTLVTFIICIIAVYLGKKFGTKLGNKAEIIGGIILIGIGLEIFISGMFF